MSPTNPMTWRYAARRLQLVIGSTAATCGTTHWVPSAVAAQVMRTASLAADPAESILLAEQHLRLRWKQLGEHLRVLSHRIHARQPYAGASAVVPVTDEADDVDQDGVDDEIAHFHAEEQLLGVLTTLVDLRQWVINLRLQDGPLAAAARGWARSDRRPEWVRKFTGEAECSTAARSARGVESYGQTWRRDRDDDPHGPGLRERGSWRVDLDLRGKRVLATRCLHGRETMWVLLEGGADDTTRQTINTAVTRIHEPNSLLLLADLLHQHSAQRHCLAVTGRPR